MSFLLLIAGLILLLAGSSWFTGAATVGIILTVVGGLWVGLVAAVAVLAIGGARSTRKSIRRDFNNW